MSPLAATPLARWWVPVLVLFTLHNLEEIFLDLPAWGRAHGFVLPTTQLGQAGFALLIAVLTGVIVGLAFAMRRNARWTRYLLLIFLSAMLVNFVQHIALSALTSSLQPGAVSAVALLPVYGWIGLVALRRQAG